MKPTKNEISSNTGLRQKMNDKQPQHYSITLRLRRVTYEDAYINVPVTDDLLKKNEDDTYGINPELLWKEGIKLAGNLGVEW